MSGWAAAAQAASGLGSSLIANAGNKKRQERGFRQERALMGIQTTHQKELNRQGKDLQLEMWKDTNYPAQMEMLREAGLNPSLLYGGGGGGGTTAGSQGGGAAAKGSAPAQMPMDVRGIEMAVKSMAELGLMKAQEKKVKAETESVDIQN